MLGFLWLADFKAIAGSIPFIQLPWRPQFTSSAEEAIPPNCNCDSVGLLFVGITGWICANKITSDDDFSLDDCLPSENDVRSTDDLRPTGNFVPCVLDIVRRGWKKMVWRTGKRTTRQKGLERSGEIYTYGLNVLALRRLSGHRVYMAKMACIIRPVLRHFEMRWQNIRKGGEALSRGSIHFRQL